MTSNRNGKACQLLIAVILLIGTERKVTLPVLRLIHLARNDIARRQGKSEFLVRDNGVLVQC